MKKRQMIEIICRFSSEWGDSNARPLRPERSALPTALHSDCNVCFSFAIAKVDIILIPAKEKRFFFTKKLFFLFSSYLFWRLKFLVYLCTAKPRCHSSVGRAKDWKSLCPRFDSWWHHFYKTKNHENRWNTVISAVFSLCTARKNMQFGAIKNCWFGGFFWVPWKNHRHVPYFTYSQRFAWIIFRDEILQLHFSPSCLSVPSYRL